MINEQQTIAERVPMARMMSLDDLRSLVGCGESILRKRLSEIGVDASSPFDAEQLLKSLKEHPIGKHKGYSFRRSQRLNDRVTSALAQTNLSLEPSETTSDQNEPIEAVGTEENFVIRNEVDTEQQMFSPEDTGECRRALLETFDAIEKIREQFAEGNLDVTNFARTIGNLAYDLTPDTTYKEFHLDRIAGHDRRVEIAAFDTLLLALNEVPAAAEEDADAIVAEIISQIGDTDIAEKHTYLLGLLMHHGSLERFEREHTLLDPNFSSSSELSVSRERLLRLKGAAHRLKQVFGEGSRYTPYCDLILNDFPTPKVESELMSDDEIELEHARLIAELYEGPRSVTDIDLGEHVIAEHDDEVIPNARRLSTGIPWINVILPKDRHPSTEKINEAIRHGWQIGPVAMRPKEDGKTFEVVLHPLTREENNQYTQSIREAKDARDYAQAERLRLELRQKVWDALDDYTREQMGGMDAMHVRFTTIRDEISQRTEFHNSPS